LHLLTPASAAQKWQPRASGHSQQDRIESQVGVGSEAVRQSGYFPARPEGHSSSRAIPASQSLGQHQWLVCSVREHQRYFLPQLRQRLAAAEEILHRRFAEDLRMRTRSASRSQTCQPTSPTVASVSRHVGQEQQPNSNWKWSLQLVLHEAQFDVMQIFPSEEINLIMTWISSLPNPWCTSDMSLVGLREWRPFVTT
jgi:hypothetical protein